MQAQLMRAAVLAGLVAWAAVPALAQTKPVEPPPVVSQDYIPPENLDPNLMAIQIKRLEDRVLALEQTNERLVDRVKVLTESHNALVEYLRGGSGEGQ